MLGFRSITKWKKFLPKSYFFEIKCILLQDEFSNKGDIVYG